ncbi:TIGR02206 family membrane protein [Actinomadura darangshiensis]|uniref:TIGR02206 family membrane protein n=1 Tax=Actinomadura darangshiensis TaxID=705336 RepID=A0A4R5BNP7_9ACTN|nr:TIGR02206 family membrane protein [Actinomadura darangshiensis]TDD87499.1 TIGR02206 family membrane protein [Actinomadura darangshiensis]
MPLTAAGEFAVYGPSHWAALGLFAAGCAALVPLGRAQRTEPGGGFGEQARGFSRAYALAIAYVMIGTQVYSLLPGQWRIGGSLPLQLCDLAWLTAVGALWTLGHRWFTLTYYWGLTLSVQGLLTPALHGGDYPDIDYLGFFGMHLMIVWAAVYLTWGLGMRPGWRDYRFAVAATLVWAVATFVFNLIAGTNYGYLNEKPGSASILDVLGPWPWYVLVETLVILAGWALITWPWTRR